MERADPPAAGDDPHWARLEGLFQALPDPVFLIDPALQLLQWNERFRHATGAGDRQLTARPLAELIHPDDGEALARAARAAVEDPPASVELRLRDPAGEFVPFCFRMSPVRDAYGTLQGLAGIARDVTGERALAQRLDELTTIDLLTGVANRRAIEACLASEIGRVARYGGSLSILMFDIDQLKVVNDTAGYEVADELLRRLARTVREGIRASDRVGRWSGGEFMVVAPEMDLGEATGFAVKLRRAIETAGFGDPGPVTASFGVACYRPGEPLEAVVRRADDALFLAKKRGRNRVETERT